MRAKQLQRTILNAATANGVGTPVLIADYKNIVLAVTLTTAFTTGTLKFQGAINDPLGDTTLGGGLPAFGSVASKTNQWAYVQAIRLADGTLVNGATGIDLSTGGGTTFFVELNTNGLSYINCELSSITGVGEITVKMSAYGENGI